jgi:tripartite-type tricarboxylate transporter receptor subunit TctC
MRLYKNLSILAMSLAGLSISSSSISQTTDYPNKPIKIVVGFTPGGSTDAIGRQIANSFSKILGQSVIVENKPGANGNLATDFVRRAPPDGYTIFYTSIGHVTNPLIYKDAKYDPIKDFTPIGQVLAGPNILVVPPNSRFKNLKELIDYGRANPGKINFASSGIGSSLHLSGELFKQLSGVDMVHIHTKALGVLCRTLCRVRWTSPSRICLPVCHWSSKVSYAHWVSRRVRAPMQRQLSQRLRKQACPITICRPGTA